MKSPLEQAQHLKDRFEKVQIALKSFDYKYDKFQEYKFIKAKAQTLLETCEWATDWLDNCHYEYCQDEDCSQAGIYNRMCSAIIEKSTEIKQAISICKEILS